MSRNRTALTASAILGAAIVASPALASPSMTAAGGARPHASAARPATIQLERTGLGQVLVDGTGFTLYAFSRDGNRKDRCVTISGCAHVWPLIRTHGSPRPGHGVKRSLLGTVRIRGGVVQVTYAGHPLYRYSGDVFPGATDYVGARQFGGVWRAVKPTGAPVG